MKDKTQSTERVERLFQLPTGALGRSARIELSGNRQAVIEGCRGIVKYDEDCIELRTVDGTVRFTGRELCMNSLNPSCAVVSGRLVSVEFR